MFSAARKNTAQTQVRLNGCVLKCMSSPEVSTLYMANEVLKPNLLIASMCSCSLKSDITEGKSRAKSNEFISLFKWKVVYVSCLYPVTSETLDDQFRLLFRIGQWKMSFLFPCYTSQISNLNRRRSHQKEIDLFIHWVLNGFFCVYTFSFYSSTRHTCYADGEGLV